MEKKLVEKEQINNIYLKLKSEFPMADVNTLFNISLYILRIYGDDLSLNDLKLKLLDNEGIGKVILKDGTEISFLTSSSDDELDFVVEKYDYDAYMNIFVSTECFDDLVVPFVYGTVESGGLRHYIGIDDYDNGKCIIKTYNKGKLVNNANHYFDVVLDNDNNNGIIDIMERVYLIHKDLKSLNTYIKRKRK